MGGRGRWLLLLLLSNGFKGSESKEHHEDRNSNLLNLMFVYLLLYKHAILVLSFEVFQSIPSLGTDSDEEMNCILMHVADVQTYYLPHIENFLFQNKVQNEKVMFFWMNKESELHLTCSCLQCQWLHHDKNEADKKTKNEY